MAAHTVRRHWRASRTTPSASHLVRGRGRVGLGLGLGLGSSCWLCTCAGCRSHPGRNYRPLACGERRRQLADAFEPQVEGAAVAKATWAEDSPVGSAKVTRLVVVWKPTCGNQGALDPASGSPRGSSARGREAGCLEPRAASATGRLGRAHTRAIATSLSTWWEGEVGWDGGGSGSKGSGTLTACV